MANLNELIDSDNLEHYNEKIKTWAQNEITKQVGQGVTGIFTFKGSVEFSALPEPAKDKVGWVYDVSNTFNTDSRFIEGPGKNYPPGTNVVIVESTNGVYKFDVLPGYIDLSGYLQKTEIGTIDNSEIDSWFE